MRFLFVDRILQLIPGKSIQGIKHVTRDDAWLCTENNQLAFIPSFIGETLGQLAAWNVMFTNGFTQRPVAGIVARAKMHRPAFVGESVILHAYIDNLDNDAVEYHSEAFVGNELVFSIEGALGPLLPMDDFISSIAVKQQFSEINHPGEWTAVSDSANESIPLGNTRPITLTFDSIKESIPGERLIAEELITRAAPWFADHFPHKPVLPMTVLLECKINLAKTFIAKAGFNRSYQVRELRKIKMNDFIQPGDVVVCLLKVKSFNENELVLTFRSEVDGRRVCVLEMHLSKTL